MSKYITYVNPVYEYMRSYIQQIPDIFENSGKVIYTGRNIIKVIEHEGISLNVKRYKVPFFINRIIYTFIRTSKGYRAFTYPEKVLKAGICTPQPVAYLEERRGGLIGFSYFISIQQPFTRNFYEFGTNDPEKYIDVIETFAEFTAKMHKNEIYHKDYSPGNILFDFVDNEWKFCIVDINRMYFGPIDMKMGCANFARLWGNTQFFIILAKRYALEMGYNPQKCINMVLGYREYFWKKYRKKHTVKFPLDI